MPISKKLELAGNLWTHFGPKSSHHFTVGPSADIQLVMGAARERVESAIQNYQIPEQLRNRFEWLSSGDVQIKEQLLNHFRDLERKLALSTLREQMPILQRQMRDNAAQTISVRTKMIVQRHEVEVWVDPRLGSTFREGRPASKRSSKSLAMWFVSGAIALLVLLFVLSAGH